MTANVLVTVGMGRWPFDRLVAAADRLAGCTDNDVFVQTGTSAVVPRCPHARFIAPDELGCRIAAADVVVTHAGNSVRLVQRVGKVPLAIARDPERGEMGNDHQARFLASERRSGRVVVLEHPDQLPAAVADHRALEDRLLAERPPPPPPPDPTRLAQWLDVVAFGDGDGDGPFAEHPLRRLDWAWSRLSGLDGAHLDVGCADGTLAGHLAAARSRCDVVGAVVGADPHADYLRRAAETHTSLPVVRIGIDDRLPFRDAAFSSVSVLDALEHVPDEHTLLAEVCRVLRPGGVLIVTVPALHLLSLIDPDNAKFRTPRLHRFVYRRRFGRAVYHQRFVDTSDGLVGDMSIGRDRHTNYRQRELVNLLAGAGFTTVEVDGANRWWRLYHAPALLAGHRLAQWCEQRIRVDGRRHHDANLFCSAVRR